MEDSHYLLVNAQLIITTFFCDKIRILRINLFLNLIIIQNMQSLKKIKYYIFKSICKIYYKNNNQRFRYLKNI